MTGSRISLNIHAQNTPDRKYLLQHLQKLNPPAVLVMDAAGFAKEVKAALPNTIVIHRSWGTRGDDDIHKQLTPEQWVAQKIKEIDGGDLWCYTTNEPEFGDEVIRWHIEVMERAAKVGLKLVVGNWSVGKPDNVDNDWKRAQRMLELLDQNRKTMILGLHEYACGVVTSGFVGGPPSEFRDSKGNVLHPDFIKPENWPADTVKLGALWHCGRFKFLVQHCKNVGINPPRIIITEHGFDDVSDIKPWTETLKKTPTFGNQGGNIRGWKTLEGQWGDWFGRLNWTAQRAYFEQLKYADQHIYQGSVVEAQLIFSWGHSADIWAQFDVADSRELHGLLEGYAKDPSAVTTVTTSQTTPTTTTPETRVAPPVRGGDTTPEVVVNATTQLAPDTPPPAAQHHLEDDLSAKDLQTMIAGLRAAAGIAILSNPALTTEFERLIGILAKYVK